MLVGSGCSSLVGGVGVDVAGLPATVSSRAQNVALQV